jgi:tetratricopeptide (TPR) repeat protein
VSYDRVGRVLEAHGNLPEALKAFHDSLAIMERLAKADPNNAGWQRDLAVSYERVGDVLVARGNLPEALKSHREGLAIRERLAKADPSNVQWRNDLQVTINRIGGLAYQFVLAGDFSNALDAADQVVALAPNRLWLHGNRAHALMFLGRIEEARALYLAHRGAKNVAGEKAWEAVVTEDFAELRAAKRMHPLMDEIEKQFAAPG